MPIDLADIEICFEMLDEIHMTEANNICDDLAVFEMNIINLAGILSLLLF